MPSSSTGAFDKLSRLLDPSTHGAGAEALLYMGTHGCCQRSAPFWPVVLLRGACHAVCTQWREQGSNVYKLNAHVHLQSLCSESGHTSISAAQVG